MNGLWQDIVHGVRLLRRYPSYAATAVLALGLGIGATTAIFSIVDATLLRDLPYPDPDRLVMVWEQNLDRGYPRMDAAPPNYEDWRATAMSFAALGAFTTDRRAVSGGDAATAVQGAEVTDGVFAAIGVPPRLGRVFDANDLLPGGPAVAVLGDRVWTTQFGSDPDVVGRTIEVDGEPTTVVGVMPPGFSFPPLIQESGPAVGGAELWLPLRLGPGAGRGAHFLEVVGRLRDDASVAGAEEEMRTIAAQLAREYPASNEGWSATIVPLDDQLAGQSRDQLAFLLGAVALVLVIACINVANLLLARGTTRRQEIAVRAATGASRGRLVRQFLVESTILGLAGGALGVVIARLGLRGLVGMAPETVLRAAEATLDLRVLAFTLALSVASAVLFGLLPAWSNASLDLSSHLREGGRGETGARGARRFQSAFIAGEIALSLALLVGAGLLFQTFLRLKSTDAGLRPDRTVTATVALPGSRYGTNESRVLAYAELGQRVAVLPEVEAAGFIWDVPLAGDRQGTQLTLAGETEPPDGENRGIGFSIVTSGYFDAMGIPIVRGRDFASADLPDGEPVVIVNQALADRYFEGRDPIGATAGIFGTQRTIVGVVGSVRFQSLRDDAPPTAYLFFEQQPWGGDLALAVRSRTAAEGAVDAVRREIRAFDPAIPVYDVTAMTAVLGNAVARERFSATLMGIFSALALSLAGVGVFGVVSYAVSRRVRETGIRIALGARAEDVLRLLVGQSMRPVLVGVAIGLPAALAVASILRSSLYGVGPADPVTFLGVLAVLLGVSFLATWLPARRATRVDPAIALRSD